MGRFSRVCAQPSDPRQPRSKGRRRRRLVHVQEAGPSNSSPPPPNEDLEDAVLSPLNQERSPPGSKFERAGKMPAKSSPSQIPSILKAIGSKRSPQIPNILKAIGLERQPPEEQSHAESSYSHRIFSVEAEDTMLTYCGTNMAGDEAVRTGPRPTIDSAPTSPCKKEEGVVLPPGLKAKLFCAELKRAEMGLTAPATSLSTPSPKKGKDYLQAVPKKRRYPAGSKIGLARKAPQKSRDFRSRSSSEAEVEDSEDSEDETCGKCRQGTSGGSFWIGCDDCRRWFHCRCVGITPKDAELQKTYICRLCS